MSVPLDKAPHEPTPFELVRAEARRWIVTEAYNGRKGPDDLETHETYVMAPTLARVDDFTPLPLESVLTSLDSPTPDPGSTVQTGIGMRALCWGAVTASGAAIVVFGHPVADLLALIPGALGVLGLRRVSSRPAQVSAANPAKSERVTMTSYEVVPEVAYAYRLLKAAPARLLALNADAEAIAEAERSWEVVLREVPRLPDEAWDYRGGKRARWVNNQSGSAAYVRIMEAGAEALVMLRAAEEKEFALAPQATKTGPWTRLSAEPVVVQMLDQARFAQALSPRME